MVGRVMIPWVYGIQSGLFIKIGVSNDIGQRLKHFQAGNPHPMRLVIRRQIPEAFWLERRLHAILASHSIGREWFMISVAQGRDAMKLAMQDLALRRKEQIAWELHSRDRIERTNARRPHVETHVETAQPVNN